MIGPIFAPARRTAGSGQEKRETGATRLPLFEPGFRLGRKGRLRVVPGGRPEAGVPYSAASAIIESTDTYLRPSLPSWNRTRPSAVANSVWRSEEHTSELQSLMRISYAVFGLKKKKTKTTQL